MGAHTLIQNDFTRFEPDVTASTTQTQGNGTLTADFNVVSTVANTNDTVTLPGGDEGSTVIIFNNGANTLKIFPNTDDNLGEGTNTSVTLAADSLVIFYCYDDTHWKSFSSSSGSSSTVTVAYGHMYENNSSGSSLDSTNHTLITASTGVVDSGGLVTFSDNSTGDRLVIGTGGAGDYKITGKCTQTNAGGKKSTLIVRVNGSDSTLQDSLDSDSSKALPLQASGILTLAVGDYLTIYVVSESSSDTITSYNASLTINRVS